jgi:hypothetical protein
MDQQTTSQQFKAVVLNSRPLDSKTVGNRGKFEGPDATDTFLFHAKTTSSDDAPKLAGTSVSELIVYQLGRVAYEFPTNGHNVPGPTQEIIDALAETPELKQ